MILACQRAVHHQHRPGRREHHGGHHDGPHRPQQQEMRAVPDAGHHPGGRPRHRAVPCPAPWPQSTTTRGAARRGRPRWKRRARATARPRPPVCARDDREGGSNVHRRRGGSAAIDDALEILTVRTCTAYRRSSARGVKVRLARRSRKGLRRSLARSSARKTARTVRCSCRSCRPTPGRARARGSLTRRPAQNDPPPGGRCCRDEAARSRSD